MTLFNVPDELPDDEYFEDLPDDPVSESQARAVAHGKEFDLEAIEFLIGLGATVIDTKVEVDGYPLDAIIEGRNGARFLVDAHGTPDRADRNQAGIRRTDTLYKFGFKAQRLAVRGHTNLLLITSHLPKTGTQAEFLLMELGDSIFDVAATHKDLAGYQRLHHYLNDTPAPTTPRTASWRLTADKSPQSIQLSIENKEDA